MTWSKRAVVVVVLLAVAFFATPAPTGAVGPAPARADAEGAGGQNAAAEAFERSSALEAGETIRLVPPPFHPGRLRFQRREGVTEDRPDHLAAAMLLKWKGRTLRLWGRKSSSVPWYTVRDLVGHLVRVPAWAVEGDEALKGLMLPGDVVVADGASPEACRGALERIIGGQTGKKASLELRDVERPVVVLKGGWRYTPVEDRARDGGVPTLELYDARLTRPVQPGEDADATLDDAAAAISAYVQEEVMIECTGAPERLRLRVNDVGVSGPGVGSGHDRTLVLKRLEEQTGLSAIEETRRVRRLLISAVPRPAT